MDFHITTLIKLLFSKDRELYCNLKKITGYYPCNIKVYKLALSHKSMMKRDKKGKLINNERLEFLGDAVLGAAVSHIVFKHFPNKHEGFLTTTRSKLVQRDTLGKLADEMGITKLVHISNNSSSHNSYIGGNAFEALVRALYLDRGYEKCLEFIQEKILSKIINIDKIAYKEVNFKSKLLEWSQKNHIDVKFELINHMQDTNGNPIFEYQTVLENIRCCQGKGFSKKESQQLAAKLTLEKLRNDYKLLDSIYASKNERIKLISDI